MGYTGIDWDAGPRRTFTENIVLWLTIAAIFLSCTYIYLELTEKAADDWYWHFNYENIRLKWKPVLIMVLSCFQLIRVLEMGQTQGIPNGTLNVLMFAIPLANLIINGAYFIEYNLDLSLPYVESIVNLIESLWKQTQYILLICGIEIFSQLFVLIGLRKD
jgi:hypothetical protein